MDGSYMDVTHMDGSYSVRAMPSIIGPIEAMQQKCTQLLENFYFNHCVFNLMLFLFAQLRQKCKIAFEKRQKLLFMTGNMNVRMEPTLCAMYPLPIVIPIPSNQLPAEQKYECARRSILSQ